MRKYILSMAILGLLIFALAGCGNTQKNDLPNSEAQSDTATADSETQSNTATSKFQMPEEGYYSNDFDEILNITKEDDGTYSIEYSVTHLLYVENAIGTYDSETGILSFSGKDDSGNDIKANIENKGDHLEVTVTQSSHEDIVGSGVITTFFPLHKLPDLSSLPILQNHRCHLSKFAA